MGDRRIGARARTLAACAVAVLAAGAAVAGGCGSSGDDAQQGTATTQLARGRTLFAERCSGCHTLAAAGARGSATDPHRQERTDGVNFDQRKVDEQDVLSAIRNGGFASKIMPAGIVSGDDAEAVAAFVAAHSGTKAATTPDATVESPAVRKMRSAAPDGGTPPISATSDASDPRFLRAAFDSAQALWAQQFQAAGETYRPAHVVFFHTEIHSPCGHQTITTGPFYCPAGMGVYLNTDFFEALARAYGLRSAFAAGYVTAHEVGHHVQQLLGLHRRVAQLDASDPAGANARSIKVELQADCYAGVWLHAIARTGELTAADVEDIIKAATVVGDDFQRNQAGTELAPETWTHGSSSQRTHWLAVGKESGAPAACDTFTSSS
jgi:predicted metalloprotease